MPSFTTIAAFATLAFSAFTSAAPIVNNEVNVATAPVSVLSGSELSLVDRDAKTLPDILGELVTSLTPLVADLGSITTANATADVITPIVDDIKGVLNTAITEVKTLVGQPLEVILGTVDSIVGINELVKVLGPLLTLVFTALGSVLTVIGGVKGEVFTLLQGVGALVGELLQLVLSLVGSLVGGLLGALLPIIGGIIPVILNLNVASVVSLLGL